MVFEALDGLDTDIKMADFKKLLKVITGEIGVNIRSLSMLYGILDKKSCKSFTELLVGNAQRTTLARVLKDNAELCISTTAATAATVVLSRMHSQHKLDAAFSGGESFERLVDFAQYVTKTDRYGYMFKYAAQVLIFYKLSAKGH